VKVACDLHPGYFSTRFAENYTLSASHYPLYAIRSTLIKVQHHEAHIASAIVDNDIKGDVIGVAFDGTGYGSDGNIWGGEFFVGSLKGFKRTAHLEYIPMPGGEKAIKEPWRMAVSYLYRAFGNKLPMLANRWRREDLVILKAMVEKNINSPLTSSAGRFFDAAGSLILAKDVAVKEAELPVELERLSFGRDCDGYSFNMQAHEGGFVIAVSDIIKGVVRDIAKRIGAPVMSSRFHNTIADIILKASLRLRRRSKIRKVVLSGGVFQNRYLTTRAAEALGSSGFKVYTHSEVSTNDSGIPIGQIAIASTRGICV
jgi:hydrogenase maturation protein HypF